MEIPVASIVPDTLRIWRHRNAVIIGYSNSLRRRLTLTKLER